MFGLSYDHKPTRGGGDAHSIVCADWDASARNPTACPIDPHASRSTIVNPAGSFVDTMKDASSARESPAAKCVCPFCVGAPTRSTCARWYGKNTNRPNARQFAFADEITTFTSSIARAATRAPRFAVRVCFATRLFRASRRRLVSPRVALDRDARSRPSLRVHRSCVRARARARRRAARARRARRLALLLSRTFAAWRSCESVRSCARASSSGCGAREDTPADRVARSTGRDSCASPWGATIRVAISAR